MSDAEKHLLETKVEVEIEHNKYLLRFPNNRTLAISPLMAIQYLNEQKRLKELTSN